MATEDTTPLDAHTLSTLTDEERAAIAEADDDEIASLKNIAGSAKDDPDSDDDGEEDGDVVLDADGNEVAPAADAAAAIPTPKVEAVKDGAPEVIAETPPPAATAPQQSIGYRYDLPDDFEEQVAANSVATKGLFKQLSDGEINIEELQAKQAELADERRNLDSMRIQHDIAQQSQKQAAEIYRQNAIGQLFAHAASAAEGAIDYRSDEVKVRDLDAFVRVLANDPKNNERSFEWFLNEAHKRVLTLHGVSPVAAVSAKPAAVDPKKAVADALAKRKVNLDDAPKTLAQVPGGDGAGDVGGEFDDVMSLEGDAFERAIEKMAKTAPDRFARFQANSQ